MIEPRSSVLTLRGRRVHVRQWGGDGDPLILMLHGWMDTSFTFQFLAHEMLAAGRWRIVAPDLRGFGHSEWSRENTSGYWFADYIADLDALCDELSPTQPLNLVGHSLGGNIVGIYAGVRPQRVRRLISLDGFGVPRGKAAQAPEKMRAWLDAVKAPESLKPYASLEAVAARLQKNDPYLSEEMAHRLAQGWTTRHSDGSFHILADPAHKYPFPSVYQLEETLRIWNQITAPTLWLGATHSHIAQWLGYGRDNPAEMGEDSRHSDEFQTRLAAFANLTFELVSEASHNLHHERAALVANRIARFIGEDSTLSV